MSVGIANGPDPYQTACFSLICIKMFLLRVNTVCSGSSILILIVSFYFISFSATFFVTYFVLICIPSVR